MQLTQEQVEAAKLLLMRREARAKLVQWCRLNNFEPARHHLLLIDKLEAVVRGEIKRLMIFMPPGSAKSTYSSVLFPPWFLAQRPNSNILSASHSTDLAEEWGRRCRNLISEHDKALGYTLRKDSQAADKWATSNGGIFIAAGVGKRIAGRRADLGLIDDPVGSREDAYSLKIQQSTWDWYKFDFRTRLKPGAAIVIIQTRWHEEDLSGKLLKEEPGEWTVINIPMIAKQGEVDALGRQPGEMLWPDYFTPDLLRDAQKDRTMFSALYQQDPTPEDGDYFRREWVEPFAYDINETPDWSKLTMYATSDHAVSEEQYADFSCMPMGGVDDKGILWIHPFITWDQLNSGDAVSAMINMMGMYELRTWWAEKGHISKSIGPFLREKMREVGRYTFVDEITPSNDKQTRAQSIRARFQCGTVRLPRFASWYQKALNELMKFPAGSKDDFVDAMGLFGLGLDKMIPGRRTPKPRDETLHMKPTVITLDWVRKATDRHKRARALALLN